MAEPQSQGPASTVVAKVQRILALLAGVVETRVRLAVLELEQEKNSLLQLLLLVGLTLLFTAFGLMSLIALIIWGLDPQYRLLALGWITGILLGLALLTGIWTLVRVRKSTLLSATRRELSADRQLLEEESR